MKYNIDGNDIYIIRILYGGRDYVSILFDNESDVLDVEPDDIEQASGDIETLPF